MKILSKPGPLMAPLPAVMVTCGDMENSNIITIAWTGIINTNPPMTYVSVQRSRHSYDIIKERGEFVINVTTEDLVKAMDYCGVKSGRDVDKFKELALAKEPADLVAAPLIAESPVNLECKVVDVKEMNSHVMFMAEIVAVHIDDRYVDENGAYDYGSMKFVAFNHGKYYKVDSKPLGFFGYSIMKPKTAKRKRQELPRRKNVQDKKELSENKKLSRTQRTSRNTISKNDKEARDGIHRRKNSRNR